MIIRIQTRDVRLSRLTRKLKSRDAEIAALYTGLAEFWAVSTDQGTHMRATDIHARIIVIQSEAFAASMKG